VELDLVGETRDRLGIVRLDSFSFISFALSGAEGGEGEE
jgi:hypothetical protein